MARLVKTLKGLWSLVIGLKITGVEFCRPWITVHYPWLEVKNLATFRGHIELVPAPDNPTAPKCIMCLKCVEVCPSGCISLKMHIKGEETTEVTQESGLSLAPGVLVPGSVHKTLPPEKIERVLDDYRVSYSYCSLCGLCVQSCPVAAIRFSRDAYLVSRERESLELDLLKRLKSPAITTGSSAPEPSKGIYKVADLAKVPDMVRFAEKKLKIRNPRHLPSHEAKAVQAKS